MLTPLLRKNMEITEDQITWKVSKYGVFFGPCFPVFGLDTDQKKYRIWTLFMQCHTA